MFGWILFFCMCSIYTGAFNGGLCPTPKRKNIILIFMYVQCKITVMRLDLALVARNLYSSRAKAIAAIRAGLVRINGVVSQKPSQSVSDTDVVVAGELPYSSGRGSLKLARALDVFGVNPAGCVCLDVGASTGGFTEVLLKHNAAKVFAVDVGTNQLIDELKNDSRVVSMEQTDIRAMTPIAPVDLIVVDVSFISLVNIVDALVQWNAAQIIALIKPQFEVARNVAARNRGVIKNDADRQSAIKNVVAAFEKHDYVQFGIIESPIRGGSGNIEYLVYFRKKD